jgi:hypothetical protein
VLARTGLARDEGQAHVRRKAANHPEQILHFRRAADHAAELEPAREIAFHRQDVAPTLDLLTHAREQLIQPAEIERLREVVHRAELHRFDGGVDRCVTGHQHGLAMRVHVANRAEDIQPADLGHPQVHHDQIGPTRLNQRDGFAASRTHRDLKARPFGEP